MWCCQAFFAYYALPNVKILRNMQNLLHIVGKYAIFKKYCVMTGYYLQPFDVKVF